MDWRNKSLYIHSCDENIIRIIPNILKCIKNNNFEFTASELNIYHIMIYVDRR